MTTRRQRLTQAFSAVIRTFSPMPDGAVCRTPAQGRRISAIGPGRLDTSMLAAICSALSHYRETESRLNADPEDLARAAIYMNTYECAGDEVARQMALTTAVTIEIRDDAIRVQHQAAVAALQALAGGTRDLGLPMQAYSREIP